MKHLFTIFAAIALSASGLFAQETFSDDFSVCANEWKHAFSKDGIKDWKPEFTLRYYSGLFTSGPMFTGGVRIDEKRTFALFVNQGETYLDFAPGYLYTISAGINFRRYWHLGRRKTFSFYSDLYTGGGWIYQINGKYQGPADSDSPEEVIDENVGDAIFIFGWQPGIRIRFYKNLHLFIGPTIATSCLGLHLGIGF
ncbi:MAG: hypothetical protein ACI4AE_01530 [Candidatus Cryptobacteroides sp.]